MLDDRKAAILRAVVAQYIETAQPVGSTHVVESTHIGVSSATVRNEMTLLEREGFLAQPHTSAGRIPTEKGYRFFVDQLGGPGELGPSQVREVRAFFSHTHGELERMLKDTSRLLSKLTATTAVVVGEPADSSVIRSVQLVGLGERTYLAVAVLSSGSVLKRTIETPDPVTDEELAVAAAALIEHLGGRGLAELSPPPPSGDPRTDTIVAGAIGGLRAAVADEGRPVFVEGAAHIASAFQTRDSLQEALVLLEQQLTVVSLLEDVLGRGLSVAIGTETGVSSLTECSIVVAPYLVGGEHAGTIALLGSTRMNYPETLAAVSAVSQRLSKMLTEGG